MKQIHENFHSNDLHITQQILLVDRKTLKQLGFFSFHNLIFQLLFFKKNLFIHLFF